MESLNSFKDVYSDFKTDLENKMTQRKGRIKDGIIYGEYYDLPITKNKIVYYFHQEDSQNPVFRMMADYMLSEMQKKKSHLSSLYQIKFKGKYCQPNTEVSY